MFLVHAEHSLWVWEGAEVPAANHQAYMNAINDFCQQL